MLTELKRGKFLLSAACNNCDASATVNENCPAKACRIIDSLVAWVSDRVLAN